MGWGLLYEFGEVGLGLRAVESAGLDVVLLVEPLETLLPLLPFLLEFVLVEEVGL